PEHRGWDSVPAIFGQPIRRGHGEDGRGVQRWPGRVEEVWRLGAALRRDAGLRPKGDSALLSVQGAFSAPSRPPSLMSMTTPRTMNGGNGNPVDDAFLQDLYRGGELLAEGKVMEAREYLERAGQLQPQDEKCQNLLGLTYFKLGQFDRAASIYDTLVR